MRGKITLYQTHAGKKETKEMIYSQIFKKPNEKITFPASCLFCLGGDGITLGMHAHVHGGQRPACLTKPELKTHELQGLCLDQPRGFTHMPRLALTSTLRIHPGVPMLAQQAPMSHLSGCLLTIV